MKTFLLIISALALILASCEKINSDNYSDPMLKIGDNLEYSYNDFELYDSSTHILYFKFNHSEFDDYKQSSFAFYADTFKIYQGSFWPGFLSSFPADPYISSFPFFYQNYALRFEYLDQGKVDPRNDDRLISAFKNRDLLHSGLSAEIKSIVINGSRLTFSFVVTNRDQSDLLILDPDKMGPNLFHYFTNEPIFFNIAQNKVYYCSIEHQTPSPWNSWKIDWLSQLKYGDSRQFTLNYTIVSPLNPGVYKVSFEFPGLSCQVTKDQLFQDDKRIWLGDIQVTKKITIQ
ncbi:MAG: hypothetical protein Q7T72_07555 [Bacteroidales bacterium]|nr:hypothetical protein [Bacteroidales bacterium]MDP3002716.1 hypothetical protein [Bacteroidales bacterium]